MKAIILFAATLVLSGNALYAQVNNLQNREKTLGSSFYNPNTVVRVEGRITDIKSVTHEGEAFAGIHIKLQTADKIRDVHLGPSWYIDKQDVKLHVNDKVAVTGSEVTYNGSKVIVAARIEKGQKTLELRDPTNGVPLWSGGNRKPAITSSQPK